MHPLMGGKLENIIPMMLFLVSMYKTVGSIEIIKYIKSVIILRPVKVE